MLHPSPDDIDALLPQTQCGLCGHGGCMPYAEALIYENEAINLCPPGGVKTLKKLGELLQKDPTPFIAEMANSEKPKTVAVIREAECIGCTKCIQACPVDAILGGSKLMHTVIAAECTGCDLCIPACPVDCIDMIELQQTDDEEILANHYRIRFNNRQKRLAEEKKEKKKSQQNLSLAAKKNYIQEAIARAKAKRV